MATIYSLVFCASGTVKKRQALDSEGMAGRESLQVGQNIIHEPLVQREKIVFISFHIKLSLMKQFVKALSAESDYFKYLGNGITIEKQKAGIFGGPQITKLMNDREFIKSMNNLEKNAWEIFVSVVKKILRWKQNLAITKS